MSTLDFKHLSKVSLANQAVLGLVMIPLARLVRILGLISRDAEAFLVITGSLLLSFTVGALARRLASEEGHAPDFPRRLRAGLLAVGIYLSAGSVLLRTVMALCGAHLEPTPWAALLVAFAILGPVLVTSAITIPSPKSSTDSNEQ